MIAAWMLRATITALCITIAATLTDRAARLAGRPQRWAWLVALLASVAVPAAATQVTWGRPLEMLLAHATRIAPAVVTSATATYAGPASAATPWWDLSARVTTVLPSDRLLLTLWGIASVVAALLVLGTHAWTVIRCARWHRDRLDSVPVLVAPALGPAVIGVLNPVIVVPAWILGVPRAARRLILQHEREHVIAHDPLVLALGALAVVAMPWNVCVWWQYRRLRAAVENDCDARVLARGHDVRRYGEVLLQVAARAFALPLALSSPAFGGRGAHVRRRILAMTARRAPRNPHRVQCAALTAGAVAAVAAACDSSARPPEPTAPGPAALTRAVAAGAPRIIETVLTTAHAPTRRDDAPRALSTHDAVVLTGRATFKVRGAVVLTAVQPISLRLVDGTVALLRDTLRLQSVIPAVIRVGASADTIVAPHAFHVQLSTPALPTP